MASGSPSLAVAREAALAPVVESAPPPRRCPCLPVVVGLTSASLEHHRALGAGFSPSPLLRWAGKSANLRVGRGGCASPDAWESKMLGRLLAGFRSISR